MIELWGRKNAYNVQKPLWFLAELGVDFTHHDIGSNDGDLESAEFLALNPRARIPVLRQGDAIIWESNTILRYLANHLAETAYYPLDPLQRSQVERWMDWELASLQPAFIHLFWNYYRTPAGVRNRSQISAAQLQCRLQFQFLDDHLAKHDYLAGDDFSLADIACGVCLFRYLNMGLAVHAPAQVMRWYQRLSQRAPFKHTIMQPFDELEGRIEF